MEKTKVKVLSGYRITIPEEARRRLSIKVGDELEFSLEGNRIIYKMLGIPEDPVFVMLGVAGGELKILSETEESVIGEVKEKLKRE